MQWESARAEQRTTFTVLVMDIETTVVIEPEEAVRYSARCWSPYLAVFRRPAAPQQADETNSRADHPILLQRWTDLKLTCVPRTCLRPKISTTSAIEPRGGARKTLSRRANLGLTRSRDQGSTRIDVLTRKKLENGPVAGLGKYQAVTHHPSAPLCAGLFTLNQNKQQGLRHQRPREHKGT